MNSARYSHSASTHTGGHHSRARSQVTRTPGCAGGQEIASRRSLPERQAAADAGQTPHVRRGCRLWSGAIRLCPPPLRCGWARRALRLAARLLPATPPPATRASRRPHSRPRHTHAHTRPGGPPTAEGNRCRWERRWSARRPCAPARPRGGDSRWQSSVRNARGGWRQAARKPPLPSDATHLRGPGLRPPREPASEQRSRVLSPSGAPRRSLAPNPPACAQVVSVSDASMASGDESGSSVLSGFAPQAVRTYRSHHSVRARKATARPGRRRLAANRGGAAGAPPPSQPAVTLGTCPALEALGPGAGMGPAGSPVDQKTPGGLGRSWCTGRGPARMTSQSLW